MLTEHESPRYDHHPMIPFVRERKKLAAYANIYQSFRKGLLLKRKVKFRLDHKLLIGKWAHATWEEWELPSHEYRRPNFDRCKSPMLTGRVSSISVIFQAPRKKVLLISMVFFLHSPYIRDLPLCHSGPCYWWIRSQIVQLHVPWQNLPSHYCRLHQS